MLPELRRSLLRSPSPLPNELRRHLSRLKEVLSAYVSWAEKAQRAGEITPQQLQAYKTRLLLMTEEVANLPVDADLQVRSANDGQCSLQKGKRHGTQRDAARRRKVE